MRKKESHVPFLYARAHCTRLSRPTRYRYYIILYPTWENDPSRLPCTRDEAYISHALSRRHPAPTTGSKIVSPPGRGLKMTRATVVRWFRVAYSRPVRLSPVRTFADNIGRRTIFVRFFICFRQFFQLSRRIRTTVRYLFISGTSVYNTGACKQCAGSVGQRFPLPTPIRTERLFERTGLSNGPKNRRRSCGPNNGRKSVNNEIKFARDFGRRAIVVSNVMFVPNNWLPPHSVRPPGEGIL